MDAVLLDYPKEFLSVPVLPVRSQLIWGLSSSFADQSTPKLSDADICENDTLSLQLSYLFRVCPHSTFLHRPQLNQKVQVSETSEDVWNNNLKTELSSDREYQFSQVICICTNLTEQGQYVGQTLSLRARQLKLDLSMCNL